MIEDTGSLNIDYDKACGLNSEAIELYNRKKATFFSNNIINLEKKDYSALIPSHLVESPLESSMSNLQQLLAACPTDVELLEEKEMADVCKYSHVKRFMLKEVLVLNALLGRVRRELSIILKTENKTYTSEPNIIKELEEIKANKVPKQLAIQSNRLGIPFNRWWTNLIDRTEYLKNVMSTFKSTQTIFNVSYLSDVRGLLDSYLLDCSYRRAPSMKFDDIIATFRASTVLNEKQADQLGEEEIHLFGFKVKNGFYDKSKGEFCDRQDLNTVEDCPAISMACKYVKKVQEKGDTKQITIPVINPQELDKEELNGVIPIFKAVISSKTNPRKSNPENGHICIK